MSNITTILVPTDFSKYSAAAVKYACELAETFGAELHLLHVLPGTITHDQAEFADRDKPVRARERLDLLLEPHAQLKLNVRREVLQGTAPKVIQDYARDHHIDLVVIGTHGRTGLAHVVRGSVAEKVLRSSSCPVLVLRPDQQENHSPLVQAARILHQRFGNTQSGERAEVHAQMKGRLVLAMQVSELQAGHLLDQLESINVVTWTENRWLIKPDVLDSHSPEHQAVIENSDTKPALDLLRRALDLRATDIHIDPVDQEFAVRFRIDGLLEKYCTLDHEVAEHVIHQLQTLAGQDFAEPFRPKEGQLQLPPLFSDLDVRLTTSRVAGGKAVALRLFARENVFHPLSKLGFTDDALALVQQMLRQGEGIVLVTGPTGSGKTTTVYSMLEFLGNGKRNIVSIEDPVEFSAPFVRQMSVDERHGVTMTSGLRTLLRMDPDIIFVGEIRDPEAADIAMRAAASGRHVFSTLHTRDVAATATALRDLNVNNQSLAANLTGIINQRLVRRLCANCCQRRPITVEERQAFLDHEVEPPDGVCHPVGCDICRGTGYLGRIGVFEVALSSEMVCKSVATGVPEDELRQVLRSAGTPSLTADALTKVRDEATSLSEALEMHWL